MVIATGRSRARTSARFIGPININGHAYREKSLVARPNSTSTSSIEAPFPSFFSNHASERRMACFSSSERGSSSARAGGLGQRS